jgi:hypothetical protein
MEMQIPKSFFQARTSCGAYQFYLPGILNPVVFQAIDAVTHHDLEAEGYWSHPLLDDPVNFHPGLSQSKTPGAFV